MSNQSKYNKTIESQGFSGRPFSGRPVVVAVDGICPKCGCLYDKDFPLHECPSYDEYVEIVSKGFPYLEPNELHCLSSSEEYIKEMKKVDMCGKSLIKLLDTGDMSTHYKKIFCHKAFCPDCGRRKGRVHKKRMRAVLTKLKGAKDINFGQHIFTFPQEVREIMKSRDLLNKAIRAITKIIKKNFGKRGIFINLHIGGDKNKGVYKPHINVDVVLKKEETYKLTKEKREKIKNDWNEWLLKNLGIEGKRPYNYRFKNTLRKVLHEIEYMTRPVGFAELENYDQKTQEFLVVEMKNFKYLRFGGKLSNTEYSDECEHIANDFEGKAKGYFIMQDIISIGEFNLQFRNKDLEVLGDGHYRVKPETKNKHGGNKK